jgi:hypothetical protein
MEVDLVGAAAALGAHDHPPKLRRLCGRSLAPGPSHAGDSFFNIENGLRRIPIKILFKSPMTIQSRFRRSMPISIR